MKFLLKVIFYILFFLVMLIVFLPKSNLYFFGLEQLKKNKVELTQSNIDDDLFSFGLDDIKVNYEDVEVANLSSFNLHLYLYETKLHFKDVIVDESFSKFVPRSLKNISISHSVLDPLKIDVYSKFNLGQCIGEVDLLNRVVKLKVIVSKSFKNKYRHIVRQLIRSSEKSNNEEVYTYEYKF